MGDFRYMHHGVEKFVEERVEGAGQVTDFILRTDDSSRLPLKTRPCKGAADMAHNGFKVFDSDMHVQEPPDL